MQVWGSAPVQHSQAQIQAAVLEAWARIRDSESRTGRSSHRPCGAFVGVGIDKRTHFAPLPADVSGTSRAQSRPDGTLRLAADSRPLGPVVWRVAGMKAVDDDFAILR